MKKQLVEVKSLPNVRLPEKIAREVDALVKRLPKDCKYQRKGVVPTSTELSAGERCDISLVSTEAVDRQGEVVIAKGVALDLFRRAPIVTYAHDYSGLPVGKAQWIKQVAGGLKAKTEYATKPEGWSGDWFADAVWSLTRQGALTGKSIGFLPTKIRDATPDEITKNPAWKDATAIIEEATLLEYAIAPIPVNQEAIVQAVAKGFSRDTLKKLGLKTKTPTNLLPAFLRALEKINIDPDKIIAAIKAKYQA